MNKQHKQEQQYDKITAIKTKETNNSTNDCYTSHNEQLQLQQQSHLIKRKAILWLLFKILRAQYINIYY